jgi:hypothetical protein
MPDSIPHPATQEGEKHWIPGQARNDRQATSTDLPIAAQPMKGQDQGEQIVMCLDRSVSEI